MAPKLYAGSLNLEENAYTECYLLVTRAVWAHETKWLVLIWEFLIEPIK